MAEYCKMCERSIATDDEGPCISMDMTDDAETALRLEFDGAEVEQLRAAVEAKNRERGYYGE